MIRPEHIEDWLEDDPDQYLAPEERDLVDEARAFVRSLIFETLGAEALLWAHVRASVIGYCARQSLVMEDAM